MKSEEIAKLAGVSRSTVSRVINQYPNVPEETRQKVMKVIEKYGYEPNTSARVLAGKGTNTIGLFVVSITDQNNPNRIYQNNYFAPFVDAVVDRANALGYYVLIHTVYREKDYQKVKQAFSQKRIDGGIIVGTQEDGKFMNEIVQMGYPIAIIDYEVEEILRNVAENKKLAVINAHDYKGTVDAVNYLVALGHKRIGMIKGRMNTYSGKQRFKAFQDVLKHHGISIKDEFLLDGQFLKNAAYEAVEKLISTNNLPTAIFSSNDDMALAAMEAFKKHGLRVPEDISVVGFDDVPMVSQITPALTTVRIPVYEMAKKAVEAVIEMREKKSGSCKVYHFDTQLMVRDTCMEILYI